MIIKFKVYPGDRGEKKHSRRYHFVDNSGAPIRDIYVMRPYCNDKDEITIEIKED